MHVLTKGLEWVSSGIAHAVHDSVHNGVLLTSYTYWKVNHELRTSKSNEHASAACHSAIYLSNPWNMSTQ